MIRVGLVEDNLSYLKAMQALISNQLNLLLVYTAENLLDIGSLYNALPNVVILDIDLPGVSGIDGVKMIKTKLPSAGIIMLTVFEDEEKIFDSIKAGAHGYLLKKDPPEKIIEAVNAIHCGESILNGRIARKMLDFFNRKEIDKQRNLQQYNLTKREKEILQLLISGKSYKQIAETCSISIQTLFSHSKNIYNKLNIHSRSEIAAKFN
jgi:DNA-binding NarL/FixJ family response regulator